MTVVDILKSLPVISAAFWFTIVFVQVYRGRSHTWSETFFLAGAFFAGLYALSDFYFFTTSSAPSAAIAVRLSFASLTLAITFLFAFTQVFLTRMRRLYFLLMTPTIVFLPVIWIFIVEDILYVETVPIVLPNEVVFAIWILVMGAYGSVGLANLWRTHRIVRAASPRVGKRSAGIFVTMTLVVIMGLLTNGLIGLLRIPIPAPYSTLLAIPGAMVLYSLLPLSRERIADIVHRFTSRRYTILQAFLIHGDGTMIASRMTGPTQSVDQDLFTATLDVIQNFMRTSFPVFAGKHLRTIEHGDLRIVIERGRFAYLTIVLRGEETDLLRRHMRDGLLAFETVNSEVLQRWRGDPEEAGGAEQLLKGFVRELTEGLPTEEDALL